ncbi:hypothetical protein, partial [Dyella sp.]|uniref:hypothetical protein n=1 Tax=Dyella sp. TaxID=1869338 RepID=UPI002ED302CD
PMELRIYEVPQAQTESLRQALTSALAPGGQAAVTSPTPGKLLVYAPETSQDSIASALSGLASSSKDSHAPASLNLRFWIVDAVPGDGADDASLTVLTDVLKSWRGSMGAAHFKLVEATSGAVREGGQGEIVTGYQYGYETSVSNSGDISLQLQVRNNQNGGRVQGLGLFQGQLNVTPGHFVVLAQTPGPGGDATASGDTPVARLLVMRVDRSQQR